MKVAAPSWSSLRTSFRAAQLNLETIHIPLVHIFELKYEGIV